MTGVKGNEGRRRSGVNEQELIEVLKNSRKGQIRYYTGSEETLDTQQEAENRAVGLFVRASAVADQTALRERRIQEETVLQKEILQELGFGHSPLGKARETSKCETPSPSPSQIKSANTNTNTPTIIPVSPENASFSLGDSIMSLSIEGPLIHPNSLKETPWTRTFYNTCQVDSGASQPSPPIRKPGYGIRNDPLDGEYNDTADTFALATMSPVAVHVKRVLDAFERARLAKFQAAVEAKERDWLEFERKQELALQERTEAFRRDLEKKTRSIALKWKNRKLAQERGVDEKRKEVQLLNQMRDKDFETQKLEALLEKQRAEAAEREVQAEKERLAVVAAAEARAKAEAEAKEKARLEEEQRILEEKKKAPEAKPEKDNRVPSEFRGAILNDDLTKYLTSQTLLESIQEQTAHISSTSATTAKFYMNAIKAINVPLNQISEAELQVKINHFIHLLEGKPVHVGGMRSSFVSSAERNGHLFVLNLLAFRFVKKAEAEVSERAEKVKNLNYLAQLGVQLIRRFPDLGKLVQAHFYKLCPFLVPFSYPRGDMDIREYAAAVGQEINVPKKEDDSNKNTLEATVIQVLLGRLTGYCTLYGYMIRNFEAGPQSDSKDLEPLRSFLSTGEVWLILRKTIILDPQVEVTAAMIHGLLEIMKESLARNYRGQFQKAVRYVKAHFVPKLHQVPGTGGSLARLEQYLLACGR